MPSKILVATDFSQDSERALSQAIDLALRLEAELDLVHVAVVPMPPVEMLAPTPIDFSLDEAKRAIGELEQRAAARGVVTRGHVRVGDVVLGILDAIAEIGPELVVVASHGKGAMKRMMLGSVSQSLCRRSRVPVLVVPTAGD